MRNLQTCIDDFVSKITPTDKQEEIISTAVDNLSNHLLNEDNTLHVVDVFLNGSYLRDTIIRPVEDIDVFVVIDEEQYNSNGVNPKPQSVLDKFKAYLNGKSDYEGKVRQSRPCVTIDLSKFHIDVLPALNKDGVLKIPNSTLSGWTKTSPKELLDQLNNTDTKCMNMLRPVIRAIKSWKRINGLDNFPSFHIEEIAISIFDNKSIISYKDGILTWFANACTCLCSTRFDSQDDYNKTKESIKNTYATLLEAEKLLTNQDEVGAKKKWKEVFNSRDFIIIDEEEAKMFSEKLKVGELCLGERGLSMTEGRKITQSKGFYGK